MGSSCLQTWSHSLLPSPHQADCHARRSVSVFHPPTRPWQRIRIVWQEPLLFEDGWTLTVWHTVEVHSRQSDLTSTCGLPCYVRVNFRFEGETWPQWDACFGTVALNDVPDSPERGCAETSISWVSLTGDAVDRGTYIRGKPPGTFKENLPWAIIESFKMTGLFQVQTRSGEACWQSSEKMKLSPLLNVRWLSLLPSFIPSPFCVLHLFIYLYILCKSHSVVLFFHNFINSQITM